MKSSQPVEENLSELQVEAEAETVKDGLLPEKKVMMVKAYTAWKCHEELICQMIEVDLVVFHDPGILENETHAAVAVDVAIVAVEVIAGVAVTAVAAMKAMILRKFGPFLTCSITRTGRTKQKREKTKRKNTEKTV